MIHIVITDDPHGGYWTQMFSNLKAAYKFAESRGGPNDLKRITSQKTPKTKAEWIKVFNEHQDPERF